MPERTRAEMTALVAKLIENASDLIAVIDEKGTISFQSPSVERLLGYPPAELDGTSVFELVHPDDLLGAFIRMEQVLTEPRTTRPSVIRLRHRDGSWRTFEALGTALLDDPLVRGIVVNAREITERLRLEEELRQTQKMEAIGQLAGGVAHDFNNMLAAIIGFTHLLLRDFDGDDRQRQRLEQILLASNRAAELTRQLLAFSRRQVLMPEILDLNVVVDEMRLLLERLIGEDIELTIVLTPMLANVKADRGQLEQVILNLVVNARDAMPTGGRLRIGTAIEDAREEAHGRAHGDSRSFVILVVSDSGQGMDERTRARAFEPFFTTKETGGGTGLGLATVYGIVVQSGGSISVQSELGHGASFTVCLPRVEANQAAAPIRIPAAEDRQAGSGVILLVEDESAVREMVEQVLADHGYAVLVADTPSGAIALSDRHQGRIDLLVTDVVMPEMSGRELCETLAPKRPEMRTLYISGHLDDAIIRHRILHDSVDFIGKPFTPAALLRKVHAILSATKSAHPES
jgi:two-component system cell cycle sensor histidine kinase/response regulator CckA